MLHIRTGRTVQFVSRQLGHQREQRNVQICSQLERLSYLLAEYHHQLILNHWAYVEGISTKRFYALGKNLIALPSSPPSPPRPVAQQCSKVSVAFVRFFQWKFAESQFPSFLSGSSSASLQNLSLPRV